MWAYIIWVKKWGKHSLKTSRQRVLWVTCRLAKSRSDLQNTALQKTVHIPSCAFHVTFCRLSTCKSIVSKSRTSRSSQFFTKLLYSTLTLNPTNIQGKDWQNTIKFDMKLKPKKHSWKTTLQSPYLAISWQKREFRNRGKTHSHLNLKPMKNLYHIYL